MWDTSSFFFIPLTNKFLIHYSIVINHSEYLRPGLPRAVDHHLNITFRSLGATLPTPTLHWVSRTCCLHMHNSVIPCFHFWREISQWGQWHLFSGDFCSQDTVRHPEFWHHLSMNFNYNNWTAELEEILRDDVIRPSALRQYFYHSIEFGPHPGNIEKQNPKPEEPLNYSMATCPRENDIRGSRPCSMENPMKQVRQSHSRPGQEASFQRGFFCSAWVLCSALQTTA